MNQSIDVLVDSLPTESLTVRALHALDYVAPGQWVNITNFDNMIRQVTGNGDPAFVARVRARALQLYADESQGYQRAVWIYQLVDNTDSKIGMATLANKLGEVVGLLSFLSMITPKADTSQAIDLTMKLVAEVAAFSYASGHPTAGIGDFVNALAAYEKENLIRMAAIMTFDGLIPLGPDFARKLMNTVGGMRASDLEGNATYQRIRDYLPGGTTDQALNFIGNGVGSMSNYVGGFAGRYGLSTGGVLSKLRGFIEFSDDKLDYLAGFLDMSTNYMEHTGIQSVARRLITRAAGEI